MPRTQIEEDNMPHWQIIIDLRVIWIRGHWRQKQGKGNIVFLKFNKVVSFRCYIICKSLVYLPPNDNVSMIVWAIQDHFLFLAFVWEQWPAGIDLETLNSQPWPRWAVGVYPCGGAWRCTPGGCTLYASNPKCKITMTKYLHLKLYDQNAYLMRMKMRAYWCVRDYSWKVFQPKFGTKLVGSCPKPFKHELKFKKVIFKVIWCSSRNKENEREKA